MTSLQDPRAVPRTCWTVQPVDPADTGAEGALRNRLLELLHLGYRRVLLDLSACGDVPIGKLHVLGELVAWFDASFHGSRVDIRALAPDEDLQRLLRDAGVVPQVPVVRRLADVLDGAEAEPSTPEACEQAVFLTYAVSWPHGTARERAGLQELADRLARAVVPSAGELDGFDVVGEQAVFYLYAPDCMALWQCAAPHAVRDEPPLVGVELRFGGLCAPHVHLVRDARAVAACV